MSVSQEQVLAALRAVQDPDLHKDIVTLGFVKNVQVDGETVDFTIELTTPACPVRDEMKAEAERRVAAIEKLIRSIPGAVSADDHQAARSTARRYAEEAEAKAAAVRRAEAELRRAEAVLASYEVRSPWRGVVRSVYRFPGEAVETGGVILRVAPDGPGE